MATELDTELPLRASGARAKKSIYRRLVTILMLFLGLTLLVTYIILTKLAAAPDNFPLGTTVTVLPGSGVRDIALTMREAGVVQSEMMLYFAIVLYHDPTTLKAGAYKFEEIMDVYSIAETLIKGDFNADLISFTHREGESVEDVAFRAAETLLNFDAAVFMALATSYEGKLFPETYRIPTTFTEQELFDKMRALYEETLTPLRTKIAESGLTEAEVIILASIIEREANSPESMQMVAGILRNRLNEDMYLQVDASIEYALHKTLAELTPEDLKIDSPYNTYTNPGLPPTPIGNPGLTSIIAVLEPTSSEYFFYITDEDGDFHYARTFDEHKVNIARFLR